jgi:hypothetical protein
MDFYKQVSHDIWIYIFQHLLLTYLTAPLQ